MELRSRWAKPSGGFNDGLSQALSLVQRRAPTCRPRRSPVRCFSVGGLWGLWAGVWINGLHVRVGSRVGEVRLGWWLDVWVLHGLLR